MRRTDREKGRWLLLWLLCGWLLTAAVINGILVTGMTESGSLYRGLEPFLHLDDSGKETSVVLVRILCLRIVQSAVIFWLAQRWPASVTGTLLPGLTGAGLSLSLVLMTWQQGAAGILCFLACFFPCACFYLILWSLLIRAGMTHAPWKRGRFLSGGAALLLSGVLAEAWVRPFLIKFFH